MDVFTVTAAVDALKRVIDTVQKAGQIDLVNIIVMIQQQLLEMQNKIATLEAENRNLMEKLKIKGDIYYRQNAYWVRKKDSTEDGPFCMRCWDKNKDLIRLNNLGDVDQCPECKNFYRFGRGSDEKLPDGVGGDTW